MAQQIDITSQETRIVRYAYDPQPADPLQVENVAVTSVDGAAPAEPPDWFRWELLDVSSEAQARVRLDLYVRAYDAQEAGVESFTVAADAIDEVNEPVRQTWTVHLVPLDETVAASTGLLITVGTEELTLDWTSSIDDDVAEERLYRSTTSPVDRLPENLVTTVVSPVAGAAQTYIDTGLTGGTPYHYVVETEDTSGNTALGPEANATPLVPDTSVAAPTGLTATAGTEEVSLAWTSSADTNLVEERLYRSTTSPIDPVGNPSAATLITTITVPGSSAAQSFTDTGLAGGTTYYYAVEAEDTTGNTTLSAEDSAMPLNPPNEPEPPANVLFVQTSSPEVQSHDYAAGTASALARVADTADARGIFVDPARENDISEPWLFICDRSFGVYAYTGTDLSSLTEVWSTAITDAYGVAVAPASGRIFASSYSGGTVYELARADGAATVATTALPFAMHLSIDEAAGYVFAAGGTTIDRFNLDWQTAVGATTLLSGLTSAFGVEADPTTSTLYLAHDGGLDSCAYDGSGRANITTFASATPQDVAIDADMGLAFVTHSVFLRQVDLATGTQTQLHFAGTNNFTRGVTLYPNERVYEGTILLDAEPLVHLAEETEATGSPSLEGDTPLVHLAEETEATGSPSLEGGSLLIHLAEERA